MKGINNKIVLFALIFILIGSIANSAFAISDTSIYNVSPEVRETTQFGYTINSEQTKFEKIIGSILGVITTVGIFIGAGGLMILGIQTMMASAEEKAVYKQKMLPFIIGFIILIASSALVRTIWMISSDKTEISSYNPSPTLPGPTPEPY